jgi:tetratricopeptide (TPR) repeat protein
MIPTTTMMMILFLGRQYMRTVQYDEALDMFNKAMQLRIPHLGEAHPDTAHAEVGVGEALERKGDFFKAIQYYARALGWSSPQYVITQH